MNPPQPLTLEQTPERQAAQGSGLFKTTESRARVGKWWGRHSIVTAGRRKKLSGNERGRVRIQGIKKSNVGQRGKPSLQQNASKFPAEEYVCPLTACLPTCWRYLSLGTLWCTAAYGATSGDNPGKAHMGPVVPCGMQRIDFQMTKIECLRLE